MGMYTGLRGEITLRPAVAELVREWYDDDIVTDEIAKEFDFNVWEYIGHKTYLSEVLDFAKMSRSAFIPNGQVCYMPSDWEDFSTILKSDVLVFSCSLKNYNGEIGVFVEKVLPEIAISWDLEERYEEDSESTFHKS